MANQLNWDIIKQFSSKNKLGFSFQDVVKEFPEKNIAYLSRVLNAMVRKGMLYKIARDNYHIIPLSADPGSYVPDSHLVAKYLMQGKAYYIGYTSALKIHGLIRRNSEPDSCLREGESEDWEFVVTPKQIKPAVRCLRDVNYRFIQHDALRFFGFENTRINHTEEVMVSDLEKTIVDIATRPQLCGGICELGNALYLGKDRLNQDKLLSYLASSKKRSATKRILFITELLALEWTDSHERMMEELGTGIALLDPAASDQGRKLYKFGLKINVNPIEIKNKVLEYSKNE